MSNNISNCFCWSYNALCYAFNYLTCQKNPRDDYEEILDQEYNPENYWEHGNIAAVCQMINTANNLVNEEDESKRDLYTAATTYYNAAKTLNSMNSKLTDNNVKQYLFEKYIAGHYISAIRNYEKILPSEFNDIEIMKRIIKCYRKLLPNYKINNHQMMTV